MKKRYFFFLSPKISYKGALLVWKVSVSIFTLLKRFYAFNSSQLSYSASY